MLHSFYAKRNFLKFELKAKDSYLNVEQRKIPKETSSHRYKFNKIYLSQHFNIYEQNLLQSGNRTENFLEQYTIL